MCHRMCLECLELDRDKPMLPWDLSNPHALLARPGTLPKNAAVITVSANLCRDVPLGIFQEISVRVLWG